MADNKKLLEEASVRKFMKIAGLGSRSDSFLKKKTLKEENRGERTMDPHDEDPRHENLKEDLEEEGQDLEEANDQTPDNDAHKLKRSAGSDSLEEVAEEADGDETGKVQEMKGKLATGTGKEIAGGKGLSGAGKKPAKLQYEELEEEGQELNEFDNDQGMGDGEVEPSAMDQDMGQGEPDGDEGSPDIAGLVRAIAAAIQAETGVEVSVEGGAGEGEGEEMPGGEEDMLPPPNGEEGERELEEYGMYDYKSEDPNQKMPPPKGQSLSHKDAQVSTSRQTREGKKVDAKSKIVEAVTKNVLARLASAQKKVQAKQTKPAPKRLSK